VGARWDDALRTAAQLMTGLDLDALPVRDSSCLIRSGNEPVTAFRVYAAVNIKLCLLGSNR
jgi:hypothetical protein